MKRRRYMAEILPIRRKTLYNQSINQSINKWNNKAYRWWLNKTGFIQGEVLSVILFKMSANYLIIQILNIYQKNCSRIVYFAHVRGMFQNYNKHSIVFKPPPPLLVFARPFPGKYPLSSLDTLFRPKSDETFFILLNIGIPIVCW